MVKCRQTSRSSLYELFKLILSIEKRVIEKSFIDHKHETKQVINHPMLNDLYHNYTRWAFEQMLFQYQESHKLQVKPEASPSSSNSSSGSKGNILRLQEMTQGDSAIFCVKDYHQREKYQVIIMLNDEGEVTCNCQFFRGVNIYCEHIFAVLNTL